VDESLGSLYHWYVSLNLCLVFISSPPVYHQLVKFKCHPTIPCDIPKSFEERTRPWCHIPSKDLPQHWSCNWKAYEHLGNDVHFMPSVHEYDRGYLDIEFQTCYGIPYPIKGVMYCTLKDRRNNILFQDANGDYYYWQVTMNYSRTNKGEVDTYLGHFRGGSDVLPEEFVKSSKIKSVMGVDGLRGMAGEDIEELQFIPGYKIGSKKLVDQQEELSELHHWFRACHGCTCNLIWLKDW